MEALRNWLLKNGDISLYDYFLNFMKSPEHNDIDDIIALSPEEIRAQMRCELETAMDIYANERKQYDFIYTYGQVVIWGEIEKAYRKIIFQKEIIEETSLSPDCSSYLASEDELKKILTAYAGIQIALSDLEEVLGVDRFLDRVSEGTFIVLKDMLNDVKKIVERKTEKYKVKFQAEFNSTNVNKVLAHSLVKRIDENQICDMFSSGNDQAILIVIDGFGYCQYLWNCGIDNNIENFTFNENMFSWLSRNGLSREHLLGSSFITDTSAGLAQIYLGQKSSETGICASKVYNREAGTNYIETKRIDGSDFDKMFIYKNSITDIVSTFGNDSRVYYCSKYPDPPSGFSKCIFKSADVKQIIPSERVFSVLLDDIQHGLNNGLQILYITGIDNSGHTMGAYSSFERQEHKKIDCLLRNFIIEMAFQTPAAFDGRRSIFITADHGMYESSNRMVRRQEIVEFLNQANARGIQIVENNRAMLFYNKGRTNINIAAQLLRDYFCSQRVLVDVQTKNDPEFLSCLVGTNTLCTIPDIVARFVGDGLFYSNPKANKHLLHFGGHGGYSVDEVFIPLIEIPLNNELLFAIQERFLSKK